MVYDPAKSETYKALKESEFGDTVQEIPTPVEPKVFSPAKVNTKVGSNAKRKNQQRIQTKLVYAKMILKFIFS